MSEIVQQITFHHFDDEPLRIVQIPGVLFNLIWLRWPNRIRVEEPKRGQLNNCDCHAFGLHFKDGKELKIQYIFYANRDSFLKDCAPAKQDVVLLDLMKPGQNGTLEKQGIECFNSIVKSFPLERIFVVSAYSDMFCTEQGVCALPDNCYSKPINVRKLCEVLIDKVEEYVPEG